MQRSVVGLLLPMTRVRASYSKLSKENLNLHSICNAALPRDCIHQNPIPPTAMDCHPDNSASTNLRAEMLRLINDNQRSWSGRGPATP